VALIRAIAELGGAGERVARYTGVWTRGRMGEPNASPPRKVASIGVHARDWVTWHGFALNVTTDLSYFDLMVPCGIPDVVMTSLARELGDDVAMPTVEAAVARAFGEVFALEPVATPSGWAVAVGGQTPEALAGATAGLEPSPGIRDYAGGGDGPRGDPRQERA
jgi:lipoate-protein ligase B